MPTNPAATASVPPVAFNPFEPGFAENPYSQWQALREHDPVHESPLGIWLLLAYDDVQRFVRDPATSVEDRHANPTLLDAIQQEARGDREPDGRGGRAMLMLDPPDHDRLRRLVTKAFTPRVIEGLRPRVQEMVDDILDRVGPAGEMELVSDLAFPLPFAVISEMLGVPEADGDELRQWSSVLVRTLEPVNDPEIIRAIEDAADAMYGFTSELIARKRDEPGDDLLTALIATEDGGDTLSDEELVDQVILLYIAGHETTVSLVGNGTLALLIHRDQLERLRADPSLDANAVEELLRYDPPVQMTRRITLTDVTVRDRTIPAGTFTVCVIASANRDRARWGDDADDLDLGRDGAQHHLAFGGGVHYCLGAALARLEGQVAIGSLVRRFPNLEIAGDPVWNGRLNLRGLDRLPLALG